MAYPVPSDSWDGLFLAALEDDDSVTLAPLALPLTPGAAPNISTTAAADPWLDGLPSLSALGTLAAAPRFPSRHAPPFSSPSLSTRFGLAPSTRLPSAPSTPSWSRPGLDTRSSPQGRGTRPPPLPTRPSRPCDPPFSTPLASTTTAVPPASRPLASLHIHHPPPAFTSLSNHLVRHRARRSRLLPRPRDTSPPLAAATTAAAAVEPPRSRNVLPSEPRSDDSVDALLATHALSSPYPPPRASRRPTPDNFLEAFVGGRLPFPLPLASTLDEPTSDDFLDALVEGRFSPLSIPPQPNSDAPSPLPPTATRGGPSENVADDDDDDDEDDNEERPFPFLGNEDRPFPFLGPAVMPPKRRSSDVVELAAGPANAASASKRRRPSREGAASRASAKETPRRAAAAAKRPRAHALNGHGRPSDDADLEDRDLFGSDPEDEKELVDLVDVDERDDKGEQAAQQKPANIVRLGAFQCVICMDDVTDLTVTYCGHLFCSECLHSSLHIDPTKKICPICRQKIDMRPANGHYGARAKGFWPLELKLMTAKRSGKRTAS